MPRNFSRFSRATRIASKQKLRKFIASASISKKNSQKAAHASFEYKSFEVNEKSFSMVIKCYKVFSLSTTVSIRKLSCEMNQLQIDLFLYKSDVAT